MSNRYQNPWSDKEKKFVKVNAHMGIEWLMSNTGRSRYGIQRIAFINGWSLSNKRNKNTVKTVRKYPKTPPPTPDELAQGSVKLVQSIPWPIQ